MLSLLTGSPAATPIHLLGFVDELCANEIYCFELLVEAPFVELLGERIKLRFDATTNIYDPENYELTLEQQNIVPGSHLRLLITDDPGRLENEYFASFIWIGD